MSSCEIFNPSLDAATRLLGKYDVTNYLLITNNQGPLTDPFAILDTLTEAYPERKDLYDAKRYELRKGRIRKTKGSLKGYKKFEGQQKVFRDAMYDFIRGLNINIVQEGSEEFTGLAEALDSWQTWKRNDIAPPVAAFDMLQKLLLLRDNVTDEVVAKQTASIAFAFLGRKSKLGKDLWHNIDKWNKYEELYAKYDAISKDRKKVSQEDLDVSESINEGEDAVKGPKNPWAKKQVIIEYLAEGLLKYEPGAKEKVDFDNPDIDATFFAERGYLSPYANTILKTVFAAVYNWVRRMIKGKPFTKYDSQKLNDLLFDIVDDIYKKDFKKWIRGVELRDGMLYDKKGNLLEQKFYKKTLESDPFADEIISKLFTSLDPSGNAYKLSGSQVLRKYGNTYRSFSEDVHDIDGVITLEQFRKENNSKEFLDWIYNRGLPLMRTRNVVASAINREKFKKEIIPFLEGQSWYKNLQDIFPSWTFQTAFIGRDHKNGESITITGYVEHPTRFEVDEDTGEVRPKRYVLDFFLRTAEGNYPEIFDNYWKDWKQIFEAKINMGRGKDLTDLIYFSPYQDDKYKFTNPGFRYFSFIESSINEADEPAVNKSAIVAYQGTKGPIDNRSINYFTIDKDEAKGYGPNVRTVEVDASNYLDDFSDEAKELKKEFTSKYGYQPDILDNSPEGLKKQEEFFNFLKSKGYKGLDLTGYSDSQYLISFDNSTFKGVEEQAPAPQYQKSLYDMTPAALKKSLMARFGDTGQFNKNYLTIGSYVEAVNTVNAYNKANGNLRYLDVVKANNDLSKGPQRYYIKVFKTPLPIQPTSSNSNESGIDRAWFAREIAEIDTLIEALQGTDNQLIDDVLTNTVTRDEADKAQALQTIRNLADSINMLDENGDPDVQFITIDEAIELTKNTVAPYNNEPAFFFNNKVYIVKGRLSVSSLFHEFSHPFIKYLAKQNPELFNKLAEKAWSELGKMGLQEAFLSAYPELTVNSKGFSEEIIVHILTIAAQAQLSNTPVSRSFSETISNILYQIKKFFRKLFGAGPKLSDLGVNTSFADLANEMLSEKFNIDENLETIEDIEEGKIQYSKEINDFIKELDDAVNVDKTHKTLQKNIDAMYNMMSQMLKATTEDEYQELAMLLVTDDSRDLAYITSTLGPYQSDRNRHIQDLIEDNRKLAIAFVNSLRQIETITAKIKDRILSIKEGPKLPENLYRAKYLNDFLDGYIDLTEKILTDFSKLKIDESTELSSLVQRINARAKSAKESSLFIYGEGLVDTLWEFVEPTAKKIEERWLKRKAYLQNTRRANAKLLAIEEAAYNSIKLTKESFQKMVEGDLVNSGTGAQLNALFESYLINQDPVVGSFAKYLRKNYMDMEIDIKDHKVRFATEVIPALKKAGIDAFNLLKNADEFLMTDTISEKDEQGNIYEYTVLKYLDEFIGYEWWDTEKRFKLNQAREKYYRTLNVEDRRELNRLKQEYDKWRRLYFNNKYKQEFYDKQELFERDEIGAEAKRRLDAINERIQMMKDLKRQGFEIKDETEELKIAYRDKRFLYSLTDQFGNLKEGDEKLIAERLREYRDLSSSFYESRQRPGVFLKALSDYEQQLLLRPSIAGNRASEEFLEERERWLSKNMRQSALPAYYEAMASIFESIKQLEEKKDQRIKDSAAAVIKDQLAKRNVDPDIINAINSVGDLYLFINDIASINRDENKMVAANEITDQAIQLIKNLQEVIVYTKENSGKINNLTQEENDFLHDYVQRLTLAQFGLGQMPSQDEQDRSAELFERLSYNGLTEAENKTLAQLYASLTTLREKNPSIYYLDIYNNYLSLINKQFIIDDLGENHINEVNADYFLSDDVVDEIKSQNAQFAIWFDKNHIRAQVYDGKGGFIESWQRLQVWDYSRPADNRHFESTVIPTADGTGVETIPLVPNVEYYTFDVKPQFLTEEILPNTKDASGNIIPPNKDNKGNWLPKRITQGAPADSPFINQRYLDLRKNNKVMFEALEKMKEFYISIQEDKEQSVRMYLQLARYGSDVAEDLGEGIRNVRSKGPKNIERVGVLSRWLENFKAFFTRRADAFEQGDSNFNQNLDVVDQLDFMFNKQKGSIPIEGKTAMDVNDVSRNFVKSTMRYMASLEKHKKLTQMHPMAKALDEILYDKDPESGKRIYVKNKLSSTSELIDEGPQIITYSSKKEARKARRERTRQDKKFKKYDRTRYNALKYLIEREFEGKKHSEGLNNNVALQNLFTGFSKMASFGYFALDPTSALVNYYDALMELKIEGWGFKYLDPYSLQVGKIWGLKAMSTVTAEIYQTGPKSVVGQLIEQFDPGQNYLKKSLDDGISRNIFGDLAKLNFLTNTRSWLEMLATMQTMGALMHYQKVEQNINGKKTYISYINAWEVDDTTGKLKLKEGIDPRFDIGGSEFLNVKARMQTIISNINGAFAEEDQPQAAKWVIFRIVNFIQKHLPRMLQNHYGFKGNILKGSGVARYDWGANDVHMGFYSAVINYLTKAIRSYGSGLVTPSKEEGVYIAKTIRWITLLIAIGYMKSLFFGYNPDDDEEEAQRRKGDNKRAPTPDTWKKLYQKSGPLNLFGANIQTNLDRDRGKEYAFFRLNNWLELQALYITTRVGHDQEDWLAWPGFGLTNLTGIFNLKTGAMLNPTVNNASNLINYISADITDNPAGLYQQDAGIYPWEKEGDPKWYSVLGQFMGLSGSFADPAGRQKKMETKRKNLTVQE